jgi:predicted dehydrogenase
VGGRRGAAYHPSIRAFEQRVELTAFCDHSEAARGEWQRTYPGIRTFDSYEALLDADVCDAIALATPMPQHAAQTVQAMAAGKHVMSEVTAATTIDECWQVVEAVQKAGRVYMMAENYCYTRANMMVLNMAQQGVFGAITYAEGGYIHDTRDLALSPDGGVRWRGQLRQLNGNTYPTHSAGPVSQWVGAVHGADDRLVSAATFATRPSALRAYVKERLGSEHPNARDELWTGPDSATTMVETAKGVLILLRRDASSPRPHNMFHFELQGTRAAFVSARHPKEDPLVWIDGVSSGRSPGHAEWEALWTHSARYEHPRWKRWGEQASQAGHGGGDFFVLDDFLTAIGTGGRAAIDVYDAVTWSALMPLSIESVARGGVPVAIPDFARDARPPRSGVADAHTQTGQAR